MYQCTCTGTLRFPECNKQVVGGQFDFSAGVCGTLFSTVWCVCVFVCVCVCERERERERERDREICVCSSSSVQRERGREGGTGRTDEGEGREDCVGGTEEGTVD
jgi:hypothetical protein